MKMELNDLVTKLTSVQKVVFDRPEPTVAALAKAIDRGYIHLNFTETGTELGIELIEGSFDRELLDKKTPSGQLELQGILILNYEKVKVNAVVSLTTLTGEASLIRLTDSEFASIAPKGESVQM